MSRVMVAMSGGVDSSVAAAIMVQQGHDVVGVTLKLWGGESDSGCCSVSDVEDARRVADQLGIRHSVFNMVDSFNEHVVEMYVSSHMAGLTPNPCIECNRHLKFGDLMARLDRLGYDILATGHHARIVEQQDGPWLARGADRMKDQSYVLSMLTRSQLGRILLPIGEMSKDEVRRIASDMGLRTANKPDSLDVCFISSQKGRETFLADRVPIHSGKVVRVGSNEVIGEVPAIETVTIGQRRGVGVGGGARRSYVVSKDHSAGTVTVGSESDLLVENIPLEQLAFRFDVPEPEELLQIQTAAHGRVSTAFLAENSLYLSHPIRRVAPGQTVAFYRGDLVLGSGVVRS